MSACQRSVWLVSADRPDTVMRPISRFQPLGMADGQSGWFSSTGVVQIERIAHNRAGGCHSFEHNQPPMGISFNFGRAWRSEPNHVQTNTPASVEVYQPSLRLVCPVSSPPQALPRGDAWNFRAAGLPGFLLLDSKKSHRVVVQNVPFLFATEERR